uniref:Sepiapterin reductase n=1 Tax=Ixodes ricinus TaxID=34613 RepID=V5HR69_IXORI
MAEATGDCEKASFWGKKFLILVTGASGGIGRAIAVGFAKHVAPGSLIVITGRNTAGLEETKRLIGDLGRDVNVVVETCDHARASFRDYQGLLRRASTRVESPERVVLVHNAATTGDISQYAVSYDDERVIDDYYHLNLTSVMTLTAAFLQHYGADSRPSRTIVNITSRAGVEAMGGAALYCTGKAARNMYMKVVALENPSVSVLNYAPGPVDTAMFAQLKKGTKECEAMHDSTIKEGRLLTPEKTVGRLIGILEDQKFTSGDHIDYYDPQ